MNKNGDGFYWWFSNYWEDKSFTLGINFLNTPKWGAGRDTRDTYVIIGLGFWQLCIGWIYGLEPE